MFVILRRLIGRLTLLLFVGNLLVPTLTASHLAGEDDTACAPDMVRAGHRTAQIGDSAPSSRLRHCDVCHWLQAVASTTVSVPTSADHGLVAGGVAVRGSSPSPLRLPLARLTTRGPPPSLA